MAIFLSGAAARLSAIAAAQPRQALYEIAEAIL
jgi:hypothetical protein